MSVFPLSRHTLGKWLLVALPLLLSGCAVTPPSNQGNICQIFRQYPDWYQDAKAMKNEWGTPIPVAMAIIKQESSFRESARPPKHYALGFIPWGRVTSAYGYAQAVNGTWSDYLASTGNGGSRDDFGDALMFIGWYTSATQRQLGISKWDAYDQYLAYHEGWGGYRRGSYRNKLGLLRVARRVQQQAQTYTWQLNQCRQELDAEKSWWPF